MKGLFITGTDTDVGKTYIACEIARSLHQRGLIVHPRKPVESGCRLSGETLVAEDALLLSKASDSKDDLNEICPYRFTHPLSPRLAAALDNSRVSLAQLTEACQPVDTESVLLVEGAGGVMSPLCDDALNIDLASQLALPLVLVVKHKLGCINHTLLSIAAIEKYKLKLSAIIINQQQQVENDNDLQKIILQDTVSEISLHSSCPVFYIDHSQQLPDALITHLVDTIHHTL